MNIAIHAYHALVRPLKLIQGGMQFMITPVSLFILQPSDNLNMAGLFYRTTDMIAIIRMDNAHQRL